jgi:hypothetical protein
MSYRPLDLSVFLAEPSPLAKPAKVANDAPPPASALAGLASLAGGGPADANFEWAERAAIAEHDGELPRAVAEALADAFHPPVATRSPPADWCAWWRQEVAARQPYMGRAGAERRVWGAALTMWHFVHGARPDGHRCAGCAGPLGAQACVLPDGARIHDDHRMVGCLADYGGRWRPAAAAALARLGITPPEGWQ